MLRGAGFSPLSGEKQISPGREYNKYDALSGFSVPHARMYTTLDNKGDHHLNP